MTTPAPSLPLIHVAVASITDPAFNSRTTIDDEADATLLVSVKRDGIATPIKVVQLETGPNSYQLVYGSRRLRAARAAGLQFIPALVAPPAPEGSGEQYAIDQMVENARENLARKDLTPYEQARTFAALRKAGVKLKDVAQRVGVTEGHVSNLVSIYVQADPRIITEWSKDNQAATTGFLRQLVSEEKDHNKQLEAFKAREAQLAAPPEEPAEEPAEETEEEANPSGAETRNAPAEKFHIDKARYRALLRALGKAKSPAIAANAVKYLVGAITKIPSVIADKEEE